MIGATLHNYHTDKLVTGNNHLITSLGQGCTFFPHIMWRFENIVVVIYSIILYSKESLKGRGLITITIQTSGL
jgi:hypothetical protein